MSRRRVNVILVSILVVLLILNSTVFAMAAPAKNKGPKKDPALGVTELAKQYILEWLDQENVQKYFAEMNDAIWSYAELGLEEYKTADLVEYVLAKEGFKIERGIAGMPTALTATYGSGKPVIAILGEFDALPMIS